MGSHHSKTQHVGSVKIILLSYEISVDNLAKSILPGGVL